MFNFKQTLGHLMLAATLVGAAAQAAAAPIEVGPLYRVSIDTATLGSGPAYLGMYFLGLGGGAEATATVSGLTGALNGMPALTGSVTGAGAGSYVFSNANGGGDLVHAIQLGGMFNFDVRLATEAGSTGSTFGWALFDDVQYLGVNGDLGNLFLQPAAPVGQQVVLAAPITQLGGVTLLPEPSTAALMLVAMLALLAWQGQGGRRS